MWTALAGFRLSASILVATSMVLGGCLSDSDGGADGQSSSSPTPSPGPTPTNSAPTISGTPPTSIVVNDPYSFTPQANDADGDDLTFSISGRPSWANFDTSTGSLTGTPPPGSEGTYSEIVITVSDGSNSASLPAFAVDVTQIALGSASLSWTAPTSNSDNSPLTDLAGYNIYYGRSEGNYPNRIEIDNPSITTYLVENLSPDTYYFVATAENADGQESDYSNVAVKTVTAN